MDPILFSSIQFTIELYNANHFTEFYLWKKNGGKKEKITGRVFLLFFFSSSTFRDYDQANWISERYQKLLSTYFENLYR